MGLADDVRITVHEDKVSGSVYLSKDGVETNLRRQGYGVINLFSLLLNLSLGHNSVKVGGLKKILENKSETEAYFDYGIDVYEYASIFAIEEPEMNLHPNAQSKLADVFAHSVKEHNTTLVIETHSEYLIRRLQYLVAKGELKKEMVQIYYFNDPSQLQERDERVYPININDDGSLTRPFGPGFFDEADNIALELFLLNQSQKN